MVQFQILSDFRFIEPCYNKWYSVYFFWHLIYLHTSIISKRITILLVWAEHNIRKNPRVIEKCNSDWRFSPLFGHWKSGNLSVVCIECHTASANLNPSIVLPFKIDEQFDDMLKCLIRQPLSRAIYVCKLDKIDVGILRKRAVKACKR